MGWAGAGAGAGIGAILGGPFGAAVGAGIGGFLGDLFASDDEIPGYPLTIQHLDEEDGRLLVLTPEPGLQPPSAYMVRLFDDSRGEWVRGTDIYADDDGDFVLYAEPPGTDGVAWAFLPMGAARIGRSGDLDIHVGVFSEDGLLGVSIFTGHWPAQQPFAEWRSFTRVAQLVAKVSQHLPGGGVLAAEEFIEGLGLASSDSRHLLAVLREPCAASTHDLAVDVTLRLPGLEDADLLGALADLVKGTGSSPAGAVAEIREIAFGLGYSEQAWPQIRRDLGLDAGPVSARVSSAITTHQAYQELGLAPGATASEAKSAYRNIMKQVHPDTLVDRPRLQEAAAELSKTIEAAYRLVLEDIRGQSM